MAVLENCQFFEISINGKKLDGYSEDKQYENYIEGYSSVPVSIYKNQYGISFEPVMISLLIKPGDNGITKLYGAFLDSAANKVNINAVLRTNTTNGVVENKNFTYVNCVIRSLSINSTENGDNFYEIYFDFREVSVQLSCIEVKGDEKETKKIGPVTYSLTTREIE